MIGTVLTIALAAIAAVLAITLHEAAHGYAALAMGDDTARLAGRLSLNPLRHVDRVGTIILPGILLVTQLLALGRVAFMFGWAKPVPVAAWKFRDPRRGMMVVAAAGPAMNFGLAWLGALALPHVAGPLPGVFGYLDWVSARYPLMGGFLVPFIAYNLILGLFNLIPIPPLDGGRIVVGLLPLGAARAWARMERAGIAVVLLLIFILPLALGQFGIAFDPFRQALDTVVPWSIRVALLLSGHSIGAPVHCQLVL
ncbi:MAG: site-2 protease family protein [Acetobacteraceae bacterium]